MFCTQCGQRLPDDARFCTNCGQQLNPAGTAQGYPDNPVPIAPQQPCQAPQPPPVQYQQPQQPGREQVLLVLRTERKYSMFKMTPCHIVFMADKIMLAHLSKELQKAENDRLSQEIKASGKGFFKGSAAMMSYWSGYHNKYYQMSSQQILAEDPENRLIDNNLVSQLFFHAYNTSLSSDGSQHVTGGKLNISLAGGDALKFSHSIGHNRSIRDSLTQLFSSRLKYRN